MPPARQSRKQKIDGTTKHTKSTKKNICKIRFPFSVRSRALRELRGGKVF